MLKLLVFPICAAVTLLVCGCGGADGARSRRHDAGADAADVLLVTDGHDVCVGAGADRAACAPIVASGEPVLSAVLAPLDATADVVLVVSRPDVAVAGLGAGALRVPLRADGRDLLLWLRTLPAGTSVVCASYRAPGVGSRMVVHRSLTVGPAGVRAIDAEPDDAC